MAVRFMRNELEKLPRISSLPENLQYRVLVGQKVKGFLLGKFLLGCCSMEKIEASGLKADW